MSNDVLPNLMFIGRSLTSGILLLLCCGFIACNYYVAYRAIAHDRRGSIVPVLGGVAGAIGFLVLPVRGASSLWWTPFVVDIGSLPIIAFAAIAVVRTISRRLRKRSSLGKEGRL